MSICEAAFGFSGPFGAGGPCASASGLMSSSREVASFITGRAPSVERTAPLPTVRGTLDLVQADLVVGGIAARRARDDHDVARPENFARRNAVALERASS